jgi:two-component system, OmpR family, sensor kinase
MKHPRGVRARLLTTVVVSVAVALTLMTATFNILLARSLSRDADAVVKTRAATEAASVDLVNDRLMGPDQPDSGGLETQAWVFKGGRALEMPRVSAALDRAAVGAAAAPGVAVDVPGLDTRLYAMPASDYPSVTVVAGVSLAPYRHTQRIALLGSLVFAGLLLLVVALITRWTLRAALRPVARMTADAEAWSAHELDRRFAVGEPYDELTQLAATLDALLDRLSASLRREQRFSAEVSHELRTPLAKVQAEAELALRRERQPAEYREALETVLRNTRQMSVAIETLVAAAQQESGLARGRCDARTVMAEVAETCGTLATDNRVRIDLAEPAAPLPAGVDAEVAVRTLQPLVENACRLAATRVNLAARRDGGDVVISIDDDGPGVSADEADAIFEPGVRGSAAPGGGSTDAGSSAGAGLGLALARRLARAAGGDVTVRPAADGGHFELRLPVG